MNKFSIIVLGKYEPLKHNIPVDVIYYNGDLKDTVKKVKTKYMIFVKGTDFLSNNYFKEIIKKTEKDFDCCFINFQCNYLKCDFKQIPTEHKEIKGTLPYFGSYIWSFIFRVDKFLELFNYDKEEDFNKYVEENFKETDAISEIVYYHKPSSPKVLLDKDSFFVDRKNYVALKNVIYIASGCSGTFNGYVSWIRNIGICFADKYEITILYDDMSDRLYKEFSQKFKCIKRNNKINYICDRLLVTYSNYFYPRNILCRDKNYLFIHGNSSDYKNSKHYHDDIYSEYVAVSEVAARKSTGYYPTDNIKCVYNPYKLDENRVKPHLTLTTTMRTSNIKRADRIAAFAKILDELDIPYTWNMFTDKNENTNINGLIYRKRVVNPMPYVNDSDYFVLFSDSESFSYSVVEALSVNTKVLVTPLEVYDEIGVKDGENAYVIPFEYFEEKNKSKLKELIIKIYEDKDRKINYKFNPKLYEGFNNIFID